MGGILDKRPFERGRARFVALSLVVVVLLCAWWILGLDPSRPGAPAVVPRVPAPPELTMDVPRPSAKGDPLPLSVTSLTSENAASDPSDPSEASEASASEAGMVIARWETTPLGEPTLGLLQLERASATLGRPFGREARVSLGPRSEQHAPAGAPRRPDHLAPGEQIWERVPPGIWQIVALPGSGVIPEAPLPLRVRAGRSREVRLMLAPSGELRIRLLDAQDQPVAAASVRIVGPLPPGSRLAWEDPSERIGLKEWRRTTDPEGECLLTGVPPGQWFGVHCWSETGSQATDTIRSQPLRSAAHVLHMQAAAQILVRTIDGSSGAPLAGVTVLVIDHRLLSLRGIRQSRDIQILRAGEPTDERGQARVSVEAGAWLLARGPESDLTTVQVTPDIVAAGELTLRLDRVDSKSLRVTTADGAPVRGAVVEGTWWEWNDSGRTKGPLSRVTTDAQGAFPLEALGELPAGPFGGLRLTARHDVEGLGALDVGLENLPPQVEVDSEAAPIPKTIVLRRPGALELQFGTTGWPTPDHVERRPGWSEDDLREQVGAARVLDLELRYLGGAAFRPETSRQHGASLKVLVGEPGDDASALFEELEPGLYAVSIRSEGRSLFFTTPPLWVRPGKTTTHWVTPPRASSLGEVTLDVGSTGFLGDATATSNQATLMAEQAPGYPVSAAIPRPSIAGIFGTREQTIPDDGRVVFRHVLPGRYTIGLWLPDPAKDRGERTWRETRVFEVGPGDDLLLSVLVEATVPDGASYTTTERR